MLALSHAFAPSRARAQVPVLVLGDSGGAAHDIYQYWGGSWETYFNTPAAQRTLPKADGKLRDAAYVKAAEKYLPDILRLGADTGQNTTRQLDFFVIGRGAEINESLAFAIQRAGFGSSLLSVALQYARRCSSTHLKCWSTHPLPCFSQNTLK